MKTTTILKLAAAACSIVSFPFIIYTISKYGIEDNTALRIIFAAMVLILLICYVAVKAVSDEQKEQENESKGNSPKYYNLNDIETTALIATVITKKFYSLIGKVINTSHRHEIDEFITDLAVKYFILQEKHANQLKGRERVLDIHNFVRDELHNFSNEK